MFFPRRACHALSLGFVGVRRGSVWEGLTFTTLLNKLNKLVRHNLKELIQQKNKKYPWLHGAFELFRQAAPKWPKSDIFPVTRPLPCSSLPFGTDSRDRPPKLREKHTMQRKSER